MRLVEVCQGVGYVVGCTVVRVRKDNCIREELRMTRYYD